MAVYKFVNIKIFNLFGVENFWFLRHPKIRQLPSFHTGVGVRIFKERGCPPLLKEHFFGTFLLLVTKKYNPPRRRVARRYNSLGNFPQSGKLSLFPKRRNEEKRRGFLQSPVFCISAKLKLYYF